MDIAEYYLIVLLTIGLVSLSIELLISLSLVKKGIYGFIAYIPELLGIIIGLVVSIAFYYLSYQAFDIASFLILIFSVGFGIPLVISTVFAAIVVFITTIIVKNKRKKN